MPFPGERSSGNASGGFNVIQGLESRRRTHRARRGFWWALALAALAGLAPLAAVVAQDAGKEAKRENVYESLAIFSDVLSKLRTEYVESVDTENLIREGIEGMLSSLDPYTQYLDPDDYKYLMQGTHGSFGGLGIEIAIREGVLTVVSPIEGTPAYRMGIQGGDRIVRIDTESTKGITSEEAVKKLRGPRGTTVTITIEREGVDKLLDYTITRDIIKIESVPYAFMLENGVGYVRVSQFAEDTADELDRRLTELEGQGARGLIVDLRFNPGGLLSQAVAVSNLFVDRGNLIVSTRGRRSAQNRDYVAQVPARHAKLPLLVLVNGASASASEILAGAVQDWDLGLIVGTRSFGKGSVQSVVPLKHGGGALKITTAKYFTPSGRCIHRDEVEEAAADAEAGEEEPLRLKPSPESPGEPTAFRTKRGRPVQGGWGIMPDIEVEAPQRSETALELERRSAFFGFAVKWLARHPEVTRAPAERDLPMNEFYSYLKEEKIETTPDSLAANREYITRGLRREFALKLAGHVDAVKIALEGDTQLQEAARLFDEAPQLTLDGLFTLAASRAHTQAASHKAPVVEKD